MSVFRFRGERVLEWRRSEAEAADAAFVRASGSAREAAAAVEDAEGSLRRAAIEMRAIMRAPIEAAALERYRIWIARGDRDVAALRRTLDERLNAVRTASAALMAARQRVKALERLRERAERRYRDAERRTEMKRLDDMATVRYARRLAQEGDTRGNRSTAVG